MDNLVTMSIIGFGILIVALVFIIGTGKDEEDNETIRKYKATQFNEFTWKSDKVHKETAKFKSTLSALDYLKDAQIIDEKDYQKGLKEVDDSVKKFRKGERL